MDLEEKHSRRRGSAGPVLCPLNRRDETRGRCLPLHDVICCPVPARLLQLIAWLCLSILPQTAWPAGDCAIGVGEMVSVQGTVEIQRAAVPGWQHVKLANAVCVGDTITVGRNARAAILLANETLLRLDQETTVAFSEIAADKQSWLDLLKGALHFISRTPSSLAIRTPFVNAGVEGTEFAVRVGSDRTELWVFEGRVAFSNDKGKLSLGAAEGAVAKAGQAPRRSVVVRPRDAVQWALYYPPLTDHHMAARGAAAPAIQESLAAYETGDLAAALARLEQVPARHRDASYHTFRGALLLTVGRLDRAVVDFDRALAIDPNNGTALAWQSLVAVVRNENEKALALASRAAAADPKSPVAQTALSYSYQASFDLDKALESARQATRLDAQDSLAWARLAELHLSSGELDRALEAAQEAVARNPRVARTQSVLGFAYLTRIQTKKARTAFENAIELDQADPLPRLGMGLAKIREGELVEGRKEIEIATGLDPNNSLVRSYLGKAYFEEKRDPLAASQLAMAKELDPKDPTPWLYDAIRKQTENRPVEALKDLQKSIALNNNRAVYRSRLLLDEDLAARSANLARIYDNLGFDRLAQLEASTSLTLDPSNLSAHRFLADSYADEPRHEIARVSELLQAQLLQPANINPVQPSLAETELNIAGGGFGSATFSEYTSLFERDGTQWLATALGGNHSTLGDELILSGVKGRWSYSLGQFHYETDGFRINNDQEHDIYHAFAQFTPSPTLSLQAEVRRRETEHGDIELRFDPESFSQEDRRSLDQDTWRLGIHVEPYPHHHFVGAFSHTNRSVSLLTVDRITFAADYGEMLVNDDTSSINGHDAQVQYLFDSRLGNVVFGAGTSSFEARQQVIRRFIPLNRPIDYDPGPELTIREPRDFTVDQANAYAYFYLSGPYNTAWTFGLSYDSFDNETFDIDELNYKAGLLWDLTQNIRLRAAAFDTTKRQLTLDQTLEPTQVAGFNQFFDDSNGTKGRRYGIGLDAKITRELFAGIELTSRNVEVPTRSSGSVLWPSHDEQSHRAYINWAPSRTLAFSAEVQYEDISTTERKIFPQKLRTLALPVGVTYHHPTGAFGELVATYVDQKMHTTDDSREESQQFVSVDAQIGYRLPKRRGILSLGIRNVFDRDFGYQDLNFLRSEPKTDSRFVPERTIFAAINLSL